MSVSNRLNSALLTLVFLVTTTGSSFLTAEANGYDTAALIELLKQQDPATQALWLNPSDQSGLALYRAAVGLPGFAYLLILHDDGENPDWPGVVRYTRRELSNRGWSTLSVSVPPLPRSAKTPTTPVSDPANSSMDAATSLTQAHPFNQTLGSALSYLSNQSGLPIIVVAIGSSATLAAQLSPFWRTPQVAGLVLVDPSPAANSKGYPIESSAIDFALPVLDMVPANNPRSDPKRRLTPLNQRYRQQILPGTSAQFAENAHLVGKNIHSWGKQTVKNSGGR